MAKDLESGGSDDETIDTVSALSTGESVVMDVGSVLEMPGWQGTNPCPKYSGFQKYDEDYAKKNDCHR